MDLGPSCVEEYLFSLNRTDRARALVILSRCKSHIDVIYRVNCWSELLTSIDEFEASLPLFAHFPTNIESLSLISTGKYEEHVKGNILGHLAQILASRIAISIRICLVQSAEELLSFGDWPRAALFSYQAIKYANSSLQTIEAVYLCFQSLHQQHLDHQYLRIDNFAVDSDIITLFQMDPSMFGIGAEQCMRKECWQLVKNFLLGSEESTILSVLDVERLVLISLWANRLDVLVKSATLPLLQLLSSDGISSSCIPPVRLALVLASLIFGSQGEFASIIKGDLFLWRWWMAFASGEIDQCRFAQVLCDRYISPLIMFCPVDVLKQLKSLAMSQSR